MNKNKKNIIFNCSLLIIHLLLIIPATSQKTTAQNTQPQTAVTCPKESISSQVPSAPTQPALGSRIPVREIKVLDSTVFNEKDFGTVTQPFAGRDLTLEETRQVADAVTQFYLNKGYINTRAVAVTPSNNGILQIRVIEGRLAEIEIQGLKRINRSYICNRIKLGAGIPFNTSHLEDQLKLLRLDPLFTNIEASLRPTGKVGQSILVVRVDEANPFTKSFTIDNYSPASVGAERLGISLLHRNLTGNGEEFALSLGFAYQSGQTFIFDQVATPFGIGPDPDGVSRTSVIKFSQDYTKRSPQGAWGVRSQFNFGTGLFDATTNASPIPDGQFFSWLGQAQRVQQLNLNNLLIVQADIQLTPNSLLPSQQFVIGGGQSIRGFRQNARSGDNGFRLAIEDRMTLKRNEGGIALIQVAPFIDMGTIWNHPDNPNKVPSQKFLASAGLGLLWNNAMGIDKLSLRLDYAIPFIDLKDKGSNIQDEGFYFSLRYQP